MTSNSTPKQGILDAARKLNEQRMGAIDALASSRARIDEVRRLMAEAEAELAVKYAAAVKAGWSEPELRAVGITPPAKRANGRPPRANSSRASRADRLGVEASEAERKAADELTALSQEMGTYDQPNPETVGADA